MCDGVLAGAVSVGYSCGVVDFPGIYARISTFRNWITSITGI